MEFALEKIMAISQEAMALVKTDVGDNITPLHARMISASIENGGFFTPY
ncbi:hypothetical protein HanRHA438_Chr17g0821251 [Helianthus annuus]|nr:hypothetical protein HanOQP8_Chr17g0666481 [Helianthus annuus]KAJ0827048.1 hypothetical protein HanRHA438_Chr17g0821251 [Helianthus annuus]